MLKIMNKLTKQLAIPLSNNYILPNIHVLVKMWDNCTLKHS